MEAMTKQMLGWAEQADAIAEQYPEEVQAFVRILALEGLLLAHSNDVRGGWAYSSYQDLVLKLGTPRKASLELPDWVDKMELQQCYSNAYEMAAGHPELTYVEGYAQCGFLPTPHAWLEDRDGRIIDPTWASTDETEAIYLGVKFDKEFLLMHAVTVGWIAFFASDWMNDAEILRLGFVTDGDLAIGMGEK